MSTEIIVASVAATLTTAAFVPQALHIIRHKETRAISLFMYVSFAIGVRALALVRLPDRQLADHHLERHHAGACTRHHRHEAEIRVSRT